LRTTRAEAGHFLSIDLPALPLALGFGSGGKPVSGILFRTSVHYAALWASPRPLGERLRDLRKSAIYRAMLRRSPVERILALDPYFAAYAQQRYGGGDKVTAIVDPVHPPATQPGTRPPADEVS